MTEDQLTRVLNFVTQFPLKWSERARLLRVAAERLEPTGKKVCEPCGKSFDPVGRQKYCSNACKQSAYEKRKKSLS